MIRQQALIKEKNITTFSQDVNKWGGYEYTSNNKISSQIANTHQTIVTLSLLNIKNKKVVDVGCGDGTYTKAYFYQGHPISIVGFDPSKAAIRQAVNSNKNSRIKFLISSIYSFKSAKKADIAIVRGVIHHLYKPQIAFKNISTLAKNIVVIEPNGYNPVLKLIEKLSPYHRKHEERSYSSLTIDRWIKASGGKIIKRKFAGLVPFFCPNWMAKILKQIEPFIESTPILSIFTCANYYVVYQTED